MRGCRVPAGVLALCTLLLTFALSCQGRIEGRPAPDSGSSVSAPDAGVDGGAGLDAGGPADAGVGRTMVYVGSPPDGRIYTYTLDRTTGSLSLTGSADAGANPSFLAVDPGHRFLYAVDEDNARVLAFAIAPGSGALTFLNSVASQGAGPAHVSVDATGHFVLVADYGGGSAAILPVATNGSLGDAVRTVQPGAMVHQLSAGPSNTYVYAPCLGSDYVAQFSFNASTGALSPLSPSHLTTAAGAGPRHLAFHPNGRWAYLINETNSTLSALSLSAGTGQMTTLQTLSTLPSGYQGANTGAEVQVHPGGAFVYVSNRGHNSIAAFSVDALGQLSLLGHTATGGATPRHFSVEPRGELLLVANQGSGTIHAFRIDAGSGALTALGLVAALNSPAYVGAIELIP